MAMALSRHDWLLYEAALDDGRYDCCLLREMMANGMFGEWRCCFLLIYHAAVCLPWIEARSDIRRRGAGTLQGEGGRES